MPLTEAFNLPRIYDADCVKHRGCKSCSESKANSWCDKGRYNRQAYCKRFCFSAKQQNFSLKNRKRQRKSYNNGFNGLHEL